MALVEHARNMLFTAERIRTDIASFSRGIKGHMCLAARASAIAEQLLDDIAEFLRVEDNQNIQIDIEERFSRDLVRLVADGGASMGVFWDNLDFQGLEKRPYRQDELTLIVHRDHLLAARKSVSFEQTLKHEHVALPQATAVHTMLSRAAARVGQTLRYRAIVSNFDAELRVVAAGLGLSITPRQIATRYENLYGIRVVALSNAWAKRRFAISFRDMESLHPAAQRLVGFLQKKAAD